MQHVCLDKVFALDANNSVTKRLCISGAKFSKNTGESISCQHTSCQYVSLSAWQSVNV